MKTDSAGRGLESLPLVPLRDMVVFPHMMQPFVVGRESSIRALEAALATPVKRLFLAAQKDPQLDEPKPEDIYEVGVVATVAQSLKLPNGHIKVMVEGVRRGRIMAFERKGEYLSVGVDLLPIRPSDVESLRDYMAKVLALFEQYAKLSHHLAFEGLAASLKIDDPERFADTLAAHLSVATAEKQTLLEAESPYERLQKLQDLLEVEIDKVNIDRRINNKVKKQMEKAQKEYYLNEKIKAIHQELGRKDDRTDEVEELKKKIETSGMPKEVREKADQELRRLEAMPPVSAEATVSRNYIEWLVGVPWKKASRESEGPDARRADPERRPLRAREGQGADPGVPGRPAARPEDQGLDHLLRRTSGRRQDVARQVDRPVPEPPVRAPLARRRARRGRDPGPPAHLHRRLPGPDHPDDEEGGRGQPRVPAGRSGQDVLRLPGRPGRGAARGARPGAEPLLRRPLPRRRVRPLEGHVHRHGQHRRSDPAGPEGPDGADPALRLHAQREDRHRPPVPRRQAARGQRAEGRPDRDRGRHRPVGHRALHARSRRPQPRARDRRSSAARSRARSCRTRSRRRSW